MTVSRRQFGVGLAAALSSAGVQDSRPQGEGAVKAVSRAKRGKDSGVKRLSWMAGGWEAQIGSDGRPLHIDETWSRPRGGRILGMSQMHGRKASFHQEFLQIVELKSGALKLEMRQGLGDKSMHYIYTSISLTDQGVVFENLDYKADRAFRLEYKKGDKPGRMIVEVSHRASAKPEEKHKIKSSRFELRKRNS